MQRADVAGGGLHRGRGQSQGLRLRGAGGGLRQAGPGCRHRGSEACGREGKAPTPSEDATSQQYAIRKLCIPRPQASWTAACSNSECHGNRRAGNGSHLVQHLLLNLRSQPRHHLHPLLPRLPLPIQLPPAPALLLPALLRSIRCRAGPLDLALQRRLPPLLVHERSMQLLYVREVRLLGTLLPLPRRVLLRSSAIAFGGGGSCLEGYGWHAVL